MAQQPPDNYAFPPVTELLSIDSTNNYALAQLRSSNLTERQENFCHGSAVFAHEQFAGKGQRGRDWLSKTGENIHLSIIIEPKALNLQHQFGLIALVALAVRSFFDKYAQSDILIKWPNDIYFQDRKAGGILIENIINGQLWKWAVVGVGLNINQVQFLGDIESKAVSLKQITGKTFDCFQLAQELRDTIMKQYAMLENGQMSEQEILRQYNNFLYKKNQNCRFEKDGTFFEAIVKEVLPNGRICLLTDIELQFDFGEVNWVIQ